ncbi:hypothetical protein P9149_25780, partial [Bacillus thuringiensis]|nr:hypothetical protein [Bacillus thuringiensis]
TTNTLPLWVNRSAKEGLTTPMNEKVTSKVITISFDEMYIEKSRTYIYFRIEDKHGNLVPYEFDTTRLDIYEDEKKRLETGKQTQAISCQVITQKLKLERDLLKLVLWRR